MEYAKVNLVMRICYVYDVLCNRDEWEVEEALLSIWFFILLFNNQRLLYIFLANVSLLLNGVHFADEKSCADVIKYNFYCLEFLFSPKYVALCFLISV